MFRKKIDGLADVMPGIYSLAAELGVEKRFSPRVTYPPNVTAGLPRFFYNDHAFRVHDISVGGCSLLDPDQIFGAQVGLTFTLVFNWGQAQETVEARLVGRVDHRRNFQFLDLPAARVDHIRQLIAPGVRGTSLHLVTSEQVRGPVLDALEVWTSAGGDSITIENQTERVATVYLSGKAWPIAREGWPRDDQNHPVAAADLDSIIMFIANAPQKSSALSRLLSKLEKTRTGPVE